MNRHQQSSTNTLIFFLSIMMTLVGHITSAQIDLQQDAKTKASTLQLKLLIFSGSDWCLPCIRFEREVLQDSSFIVFSDKHLVIEKADFPQHRKLAEEQVRHNEALAEKYNPQGYFPHVLLLNDHGKVLRQIITNRVDAADVIAQIMPYLSTNELEDFSTSLLLMGSSFQITLVSEKDKGMDYLAEAVNKIREIESWLSSWQAGSVTSSLNKEAAKHPVQVPDEYYQLVSRCLALSKLTQGAFDISFNGMGRLYEFDRQEHNLPENSTLSES